MTSAPPPVPPVADPPAWQPPPPPPPSAPPFRAQLHRSRSNKMIGGVAGGLAEYSGVDALLWRVGFVALTFAGGSGILVYLLLWLLMPAGSPAPPGSEPELEREGRLPAGPRSPVPGVTIAGLLIVVGVLVLLTNFTSWSVGPRGFLGAALLIVGLGLVAAAFTGGRRARGGLIALGIVLFLALLAVSTLPWRDFTHGGFTHGGFGDRTYIPAKAVEVQPVYRGGAGDMTVDLRAVDVSSLAAPIRTAVDHGVGNLTILVPASADVQLSLQSGIGSVQVFDRGSASSGFFPGTGSASWTGDGTPEIVLDVHQGAGDVEVSRG
ncbi:MAG: PspC domain-containing protein [Blastococcus sp.]